MLSDKSRTISTPFGDTTLPPGGAASVATKEDPAVSIALLGTRFGRMRERRRVHGRLGLRGYTESAAPAELRRSASDDASSGNDELLVQRLLPPELLLLRQFDRPVSGDVQQRPAVRAADGR